MRISSFNNDVSGKNKFSVSRRIAVCGILTTAALMLSYIEILIPPFIMPIPGFKLGLANIVTVYAVFCISDIDGAAISFCRILISSLLFGGVMSFLFSVSGAAMSFLVILLFKYILKGRFSWIGVSVASATAHNIGQLISAIFTVGIGVASYLPWLILAAVISGIFTGIILCFLMKKSFFKSINRELHKTG